MDNPKLTIDSSNFLLNNFGVCCSTFCLSTSLSIKLTFFSFLFGGSFLINCWWIFIPLIAFGKSQILENQGNQEKKESKKKAQKK